MFCHISKQQVTMIEIKDLTFSYSKAGKEIFNGLNLTIGENRICGLLGKNGVGKSTLLYLISGLLRPGKGQVLINGVSAGKRRPDILQEIFIVPEEFDLPPVSLNTYIKVNERFYPRFSREVLNKSLQDFELPLSLKLNRLSMGQKKKVCMSLALAAGTKLLLMDEPTNGLDIPSKSQFRKAVANNMSDERTMIISTHQVHDIESLLDHILILDNKKILLDSSVTDICERYTFDYRMPGEDGGDVIYAEPSLQGNASVSPRKADDPETQLNLELLFNAVIKGLVK